MTTVRRLFRNTSVLVIANGIQPLLSFYLIVTISRTMGVEGLGAYSIVFNYAAIFQIMASFGLKNLLVRNTAQRPEEAGKNLLNGVLVVLPPSLLSMGTMVAFVVLLRYDSPILWATAIVSISLVASAIADVCEGILTGVERLDVVGYSWVCENIFRVSLSLIALWQGSGLIALVWIFVASKVLKIAFYFWYIYKFIVTFNRAFDLSFARNVARQARIFAATMVCVTIYWKADVSLLSKINGLNDVGLYTAAYRFLTLSFVLVDSFVNSLFPVLSNYYRSSEAQFELACKKAVQLLMVITVPIALTLSLFSREIILIVYGQEYTDAIIILKWIIWTLLPYSISQVFAYALLASNNQKYDLFVNAAAMLFNLAANWILINRLGVMGAVYSALLSIVVYVALQFPYVVRRIINLGVWSLVTGGLRLFGAASAMVVFVLVFARMDIFTIVPLALLVYLVALFATGIFSRREWLLAKKLLTGPSS